MNKMMCRLWLSAVLCGSAWTAAEAYQLTHRWSFNSDYGDAMTGAEATRIGQNVTLSDGQLVLFGNGPNDGSLSLGTGIIGAGDTTLEIWATQNAVRNWARVFDCFVDRSNFFFISFLQGTDLTNDRVQLTAGGQGKMEVDRTMSPHVLGVPYYYVMTLKVNDDNSTTIRWMCRDTTTGHTTDRSVTVADWTPASIASWNFCLGHSAWADNGDADAAASYDEVRVWRGILSDEQLAANVAMGPDALPITYGDDPATGFTIGAGQTYPVTDAGGFVAYEGTVTLDAGAKIRFDTQNAKKPVMRFKAGGFVCPGTSILDCVELTDAANYTASLEDGGNTIVVTLNASIPVTAVWSGTAAPTVAEDLANPDNWTCYDASGAVLAGAAPGPRTLVIIPEGTTTFTIPLGVTPQWGGVQFGFGGHAPIRGGRINYGDRGGMTGYDWRAIGLNSYALLEPGIDPLPVIASDSLSRSQLRFDGWINVSAEQAGIWRFRQQVDDYCALAIDGEWILHVNSWNYEIYATRALAEGWHSFSLICGDTAGGWGPTVALDGYEIRVPIAVRLPGADAEIAFPSGGLTLGNETGVISLGGDCDWGELGPLTVSNGTVIDLNGHNLLVHDITGDYMGSMITNSASSLSALTFIVDPETSDSVNNLIISANILKARDGAGVATAYWTGDGHDGGNIANPLNWKCYSARGILMEDAVPTEATIIFIQCEGVDMQVPPDATLVCQLIKIGDGSLAADCDWRGLPVVPTLSGTFDLAGKNLQILGLVSGNDGAKVVNTSETDESEVRFTIVSGETAQMTSRIFGDKVKVIKDGYGTLTDTYLNFADSGLVTFCQNEGDVTIGNAGDSRIGGYFGGSQGHGIYRMSDGKLTVNFNLQVGAYATGEFIQSGGTVEIPFGWLSIGRFGGATGTYTLTGGTLSAVTHGLAIGEDGAGELNIGGSGIVSSRDEIRIAQNAGSVGSVKVEENGSLLAQGNFQIGTRSTGTFTQSGGTVSCNAWLAIGRYTEGIGLYTLTGGTYTSVNNAGVIGEDGDGTFDVSGTGVADLSHGISMGHTATGRGLLKVHDGGKVITSYIRQGPGRAALSFDGGTIAVPGTQAVVSEFFRGVDDVTLGPGGLTFDTGDNYVYASGVRFGSRKMEGPITKTGTGTLSLDILPSAETLSVQEGTLQILNSPKPELVHRWSFNGDYADSVGGKLASVIGTAVAFDGEGKAVVLSGNGNSTGSLNLGSSIVPTDAATIEIWTTRTGNANWSRIFDYGPNDQNYIMMGWVWGTDAAQDIVEVCNAGTKTQFRNTMAEYVAGTPYHISMTVRDNGDGSASVRWARRNVSTGYIEKWGSGVVNGWTLARLSIPVFYLGHSQYGPDSDAQAIYDEVRIWHGVLSDDELTANALLGPDSLPGDEMGNVLPADASEALQANNYLLHRWSFNGTATDEMGGPDAVLNGAVTYNGTKAVSLAGGGRGASWIDLGADAVPSDDTPFTFEVWTTVRTHNTWARLFSFGSPVSGNGSDASGMATGIFYGFRKWNYNDTAFSLYPANVGVSEETIGGLLAVNVEYHFVFVVNPDGNGGSTVGVYIYDARTGAQFARFVREYPNWTPSLMDPMCCWLGHSQWNDPDACAEYNEVRIWNAALSEAQIRANTAYGPDMVPSLTAASTLATRADLGCLDVAEGATIDLCGNTVSQGAVSGSGEIVNGTLDITSVIMPGGDGTVGTLTLPANTKVSGTIKLDVGDLINVKGQLDLTESKIEVTDIDNLTFGYVFASAEGGIVGVPDTSSLKPHGRDVRISYDKTQAKIIPTGIVIFIN